MLASIFTILAPGLPGVCHVRRNACQPKIAKSKSNLKPTQTRGTAREGGMGAGKRGRVGRGIELEDEPKGDP